MGVFKKFFFLLILCFGVLVSYLGYKANDQVPENAPFPSKFGSAFGKLFVRYTRWSLIKNIPLPLPKSNEIYSFSIEKLKQKGNNGEDVEVDLYHFIPKDKKLDDLDIVLHFHGGGFTIGKPGLQPNVVKKYIENGFIYLSLDYRLCPENSVEDMVKDVHEAIEWIKKTYGNDRYLIITGDSAGGGLVEINAREMRDNGYELYPKEKIINAGVFPWICFRGEEFCPTKYEEIADRTMVIDREIINYFVNDGNYGKFENLNLFENTQDLPPTIIFASEFDPLKREDLFYAETLKKTNKITKSVLVEGDCHGFLINQNKSWNYVIDEVINFYKDVKGEK